MEVQHAPTSAGAHMVGLESIILHRIAIAEHSCVGVSWRVGVDVHARYMPAPDIKHSACCIDGVLGERVLSKVRVVILSRHHLSKHDRTSAGVGGESVSNELKQLPVLGNRNQCDMNEAVLGASVAAAGVALEQLGVALVRRLQSVSRYVTVAKHDSSVLEGVAAETDGPSEVVE